MHNHTFLGLLAKIKCSICSLEFDNSNGGHCPPCYLTYFSGGLLNSGACTAGLAAWPWHCTTALAEHPLNHPKYKSKQQLATSYTSLMYHSHYASIYTFSMQHASLYTFSYALQPDRISTVIIQITRSTFELLRPYTALKHTA